MSDDPVPLDEQQAQLVERLRAAGGAPVTFDELRGIGIENPALLCYELAAAGLPITRTAAAAEGMPALSARLECERRPAPAAEAAPGQHTTEEISSSRPRARSLEAAAAPAPASLGRARAIGERLTRPARSALTGHALTGRRPPPRALLAVMALLAAFAAVIAIALGDLAPDRATRVGAAREPVRSVAESSRKGKSLPATPVAGRAQPPSGQLATGGRLSPVPTRISPVAAVELEAEGHRLLAAGSYASAVPALASAISASGQSLAACTEPASEACLTFAYALYDLGRALRLEGRHAEAVSILSERLRIDNQRPTVQRELELARGARA
jgi:tetratricopeptide (TPR) repeat protein